MCIDLNLKIIFFGDNISILANLLSTNVFQETWKIGNKCQHPWDIGGKMEPLFHKCSYIQPLCELVHAICPHTEVRRMMWSMRNIISSILSVEQYLKAHFYHSQKTWTCNCVCFEWDIWFKMIPWASIWGFVTWIIKEICMHSTITSWIRIRIQNNEFTKCEIFHVNTWC